MTTSHSPPPDSADESGLRTKLERLGYRVSRYVYPPGTRFATHTHAFDKLDAVVAGRFIVLMDGREQVLGPGEMIAIPAGHAHAAWVAGPQAVISLDGVRPD